MTFFFQTLKFHFLLFSKAKQAVFFTLFFPVFIFILFSSIWGMKSIEYVKFIMAGVIAMNIASEGMFSIGGVIKEYYTSGLMKMLKKTPLNITIYITSLILSRVIIISLVTLLISIIAFLMFHVDFFLNDFIHYFLGILIGLFTFSFIGLTLSYTAIKNKGNVGILNVVYYILIFSSNSFYPIGDFNPFLNSIGNLFPMNSVLNILRSENVNYIGLIIWFIVPFISFQILIKKIKNNR